MMNFKTLSKILAILQKITTEDIPKTGGHKFLHGGTLKLFFAPDLCYQFTKW